MLGQFPLYDSSSYRTPGCIPFYRSRVMRSCTPNDSGKLQETRAAGHPGHQCRRVHHGALGETRSCVELRPVRPMHHPPLKVFSSALLRLTDAPVWKQSRIGHRPPACRTARSRQVGTRGHVDSKSCRCFNPLSALITQYELERHIPDDFCRGERERCPPVLSDPGDDQRPHPWDSNHSPGANVVLG
jgi:hypothetical protein